MPTQPSCSMQAQAYQFIRDKIARCEYYPNQLLSESQLQKELGFSRTPIREAIGRLTQEGLISVYPKQGIMISGISMVDIHHIFEVRMLLEPYALRHCHNRLDLEKMLKYSSFFHEYCEGGMTSELDFYKVDDDFHSLILASMDNEYLIWLYNRIRTQNIRLRVLSGKFVDSRLLRTMQEHAEIADACLDRNWEGAALAMERHLVNSKSSSLDTILKNNVSNLF